MTSVEEQMKGKMKAKNFYSFRRQLSIYGFKREGERGQQSYFSHPYFVEGENDSLKDIVRHKQSGMKSKLSLDIKLLNTCRSLFQRVFMEENGKEYKEHVMQLFNFIKCLKNYIGIGLPFFLKELTQKLNGTFPGIVQVFDAEIRETSEIYFGSR